MASPTRFSHGRNFPFNLTDKFIDEHGGDIHADDLRKGEEALGGLVVDLHDDPALKRFHHLGRRPRMTPQEISAQLRCEKGLRFMTFGLPIIVSGSDEEMADGGGISDVAAFRQGRIDTGALAASRARAVALSANYNKPEHTTTVSRMLWCGRADDETGRGLRVTLVTPHMPWLMVRMTGDGGEPHAELSTAMGVRQTVTKTLRYWANRERREGGDGGDDEADAPFAEPVVVVERRLPIGGYAPLPELWARVHVANATALSRVAYALRNFHRAQVVGDDGKFLRANAKAAMACGLRPCGWLRVRAGEAAGNTSVTVRAEEQQLTHADIELEVADLGEAVRCLNARDGGEWPTPSAYRMAALDIEARSLDTRLAKNAPTQCCVIVTDVDERNDTRKVANFVVTRTPLPPSPEYTVVRVAPESGLQVVQAVRRLLRAVDADLVSAHHWTFDHRAMREAIVGDTQRYARVLWFPDHPTACGAFMHADAATDRPTPLRDGTNADLLPWDDYVRCVGLETQRRKYDSPIDHNEHVGYVDHGSSDDVAQKPGGLRWPFIVAANMVALDRSVGEHNEVRFSAALPALPRAPTDFAQTVELEDGARGDAERAAVASGKPEEEVAKDGSAAWVRAMGARVSTPDGDGKVVRHYEQLARTWVRTLWDRVKHAYTGGPDDCMLVVWIHAAMARLDLLPMPTPDDADFFHATATPCAFSMSMPYSKQSGARLSIRFAFDSSVVCMDTFVISKKTWPKDPSKLAAMARRLGLPSKRDMAYDVLADALTASSRMLTLRARQMGPEAAAAAAAKVERLQRNVARYVCFDGEIVNEALHTMAKWPEAMMQAWLTRGDMYSVFGSGITVGCLSICLAMMYERGLVMEPPTTDFGPQHGHPFCSTYFAHDDELKVVVDRPDGIRDVGPEWGLCGAIVLPTVVDYYGPWEARRPSDAGAGAGVSVGAGSKRARAPSPAEEDDWRLADPLRVVVVTGSRDWTDEACVRYALEGLVDPEMARAHILHHGACGGADAVAASVATSMPGWTVVAHSAGPVRNEAMIKDARPHVVLAFHSNLAESKGTAHCLKVAEREGVRAIFRFNGTEHLDRTWPGQENAPRGRFTLSWDVNSLYPSRARHDNLGWETRIRDDGFMWKGARVKGDEALRVVREELGCDVTSFNFNGKMFHVVQETDGNAYARRSLLNDMFEFLLKVRNHVKKVLMKAIKKRLKEDGVPAEERRKLKVELILLDKRQQALKVLANASYGFLAFLKSKLPAIDIANMITAGGRDTIKHMREGVETFPMDDMRAKIRELCPKLGLSADYVFGVLMRPQAATGQDAPRMIVVGGDTDSVLVQLPMWAGSASEKEVQRARIRALAWEVGEWVIERIVRERFNLRAGEGKCEATIGIKLEYVSDASLFTKQKNYALKKWEATVFKDAPSSADLRKHFGDGAADFLQKGLASVKQSTPKVIREGLADVITDLQTRGIDAAMGKVRAICRDMATGVTKTGEFVEMVMLSNPRAAGKHTILWNKLRARAARNELPSGFVVPDIGEQIPMVKCAARRDADKTNDLFDHPLCVDAQAQLSVDIAYYLDMFAEKLFQLEVPRLQCLGETAMSYALRARNVATAAAFADSKGVSALFDDDGAGGSGAGGSGAGGSGAGGSGAGGADADAPPSLCVDVHAVRLRRQKSQAAKRKKQQNNRFTAEERMVTKSIAKGGMSVKASLASQNAHEKAVGFVSVDSDLF